METGKVIRELVGRYRLRDGGAVMEALVGELYAAVGIFTNTHRLAKAAGERLGASVSDHTIGNYLGYLEESGLFFPARRYDIRARKYFGSPLKYYAADIDALQARLTATPEDRARLQENLVFNALVARGYSVDTGVVELNRRDASGRQVQTHHEISFVARSGDRRIYIQFVPDLADLDRALIPLLTTGDFFPRIIIYAGGLPPRRAKGQPESHKGSSGLSLPVPNGPRTRQSSFVDDLGIEYIGLDAFLQGHGIL